MAIYGVAVLLVTFWPVPVDSGPQARGLVQWIIRSVPGMTYGRLEFASNVAMFVPFGAGFAVLLRPRWAVLPLALLAAALIEFGQALLLPARTPSLIDVLANGFGACLGVIAIAVWQRVRERA